MTATRRRWLTVAGLLAPSVLLLVAFFVVPSIYLFRLSLNRVGPLFDIVPDTSLDNYRQSFTNDFYLGMLVGSVKLTVIVTVLCLLLGYPAAYYMIHVRSATYRTVLYAVIVSPLLISVIVRTYGWVVLLAQNGLVNAVLIRSRVVEEPVRFLGSFESVVIATTHVLLPFMVLPIASSLQNLDPVLERAAQSLGANPILTFWRVTLPLSLPGVMAGTVLVIALTLGIYITPLLVAGPLQRLLAIGVYYVTLKELNFPLGAALSFILLGFTLLVIGVTGRIVRVADRSGS